VRLARRRQAAALATGFVDAGEGGPGQPRPHQRVAVLTKGFDVLLYNHDLNILWERSLEIDIQRGLYVM
jgi:hypothetical protein